MKNLSSSDSQIQKEELLDRLTHSLRDLPIERLSELAKSLESKYPKLLTIDEAAKFLDLSSSTIRRAVKSGSIKAVQINKAGKYRISMEELNRILRKES